METAKGNMYQTRKIINSTKQQEPIKLEDPLMKPLTQHNNTVFTKIINHKRQISIYLTCKLPVNPNRKTSIYLYCMNTITIVY